MKYILKTSIMAFIKSCNFKKSLYNLATDIFLSKPIGLTIDCRCNMGFIIAQQKMKTSKNDNIDHEGEI